MASGLIPGTPVGQLFSRSSQPSTPTLQDIQENNLGGVSSGHAMSQLHPENSHKSLTIRNSQFESRISIAYTLVQKNAGELRETHLVQHR